MLKHLVLLFAALGAGPVIAQDAPAEPTAPAAAAAAPAESTAAVNPKVALHTTMGDIVIELYPDKAPKSVENFLQYVRDKHYDGTIFHRVIDGFMVQGGGFTADLKQKPVRAAIANEANNGLSNTLGTVAMARTNDPNSATAQFFVNVVDNSRLDHVSPENGFTWGYAVFGKVVEGMDVVEKIKAVETAPAGPLPKDVPKTAIVINSAEILP
ncbi:MAG TPA: peptidylprolyl isomerase [Candidatus Saccharimonadia bacterium]|nr:peptidylprolyl isomerase [Candidatus Saccharimonadia bacterium]